MRLAWLMLLLGLYARAQANPPVIGQIAPQLSGTGAPTLVCNAGMANTLYLQLDATSGRMWLCDMSTGSYAWEHLVSPIAAATTGAITTGTLLAGSCSSVVKVAMPQAVFGTNAATAAPIYSSAISTPGLLNITAWVDSNGSVSVQACALATLSSVTFTARVLLY